MDEHPCSRLRKCAFSIFAMTAINKASRRLPPRLSQRFSTLILCILKMQFVALIAAACEMYQTMRLIAGTLTARRAETQRERKRERELSPVWSWTQASHVESGRRERTRVSRGVCVMRVSDCLTGEATVWERGCACVCVRVTAQPRERTVAQSSSSAPGPARIYLKIYIYFFKYETTDIFGSEALRPTEIDTNGKASKAQRDAKAEWSNRQEIKVSERYLVCSLKR